jgi:hypothetical protein
MRSVRRLDLRHPDAIGPRWVGAWAALLLLAAFGAALGALPRPLVLPALCFTALAIAAGVAYIAWRRPMPRDAGHVTYWDIAGALTFLGACAATLSEPDQLIPLLEAPRQGR